MSTIDLSRMAHDPDKHYAGVRMQQGRVLTDDDFNDAAAIDAEELRRTRLHAIGTYGTPDGGFLPTAFTKTDGKLDFTISNGNLYLGGLRLEMSSKDSFLAQKDWLSIDPSEKYDPPRAGASSTYLAWVECWQQPVTAVEDSELFEVALGGPDTTARLRTMRRVHLTPADDATDCAAAWGAISSKWVGGTMNNGDMEFVINATLTVSFTALAAKEDLCSPPLSGGYLGAENQAIRVQIVDGDSYTWGYDNAAPLYRVALGADGKTVTLLNQPKDAVHWPLHKQVVELLPWGAELPNEEHVAEISGHLCKVDASYNPDDRTLTIDSPAPAGYSSLEYCYLRIWNRGDDLASSPAIATTGKTALGNTGLQVEFNGAGPLRAGDYWVIAARPAAPDVVVPWVLTKPEGAKPHGPTYYRAPIALVQWSADSSGKIAGTVVHDCRPPFLPLTRVRGCCSVTVGDGKESFGMFTTIQQAVNALPKSGGTVCILPGRYEESVLIKKRHNVTLHGCGPRSRIVASHQENHASSALRVEHSHDVVIESLALEGGPDSVVSILGGRVRMASCLVQTRDGNTINSPWPAVYVHGTFIEIEDNIIEALSANLDGPLIRTAAVDKITLAVAARGGLQLAGGCAHVRVAGNVIAGGTGNGITLGNILHTYTSAAENSGHRANTTDLCAPCSPVSLNPPEDPTGRITYRPGPPLHDIEIAGNVIEAHGANGISVERFFAPSGNGGIPMIAVDGLRIIRNRISGCLRRKVEPPKEKHRLMVAYGGISLAFVTDLEIDGNFIAGNGADWFTPACGVFVLMADGLRIEHNRIMDNGSRYESSSQADAQPGIRAGVHVWLAVQAGRAAQGVVARRVGVFFPGSPYGAEGGGNQLRVHGNEITQPLGRALFMLGAGTMNVTDNSLRSEGIAALTADPISVIASTVVVGNFGIGSEVREVLGALLSYGLPVHGRHLAYRNGLSRNSLLRMLPTGKLMFNDNQVSLDESGFYEAAFAATFMKLGEEAGVPSGTAQGSFGFSSVLLFSLDDVSACDNQFEYYAAKRVALADLLILGATVRSSDNRLSETLLQPDAWLSLLSFGLMNTAADNQSTHDVLVLGVEKADKDNLAL